MRHTGQVLPAVTGMNPLDLNRLESSDAILIYGLQVDTMAGSTTFTLELDTQYHKGICESFGVEASGVVLIDFVFSGVRSISFEGMLERPPGLADDEPPHDYEIARWRVKEVPLRKGRYRLDLRCYNSPRCSIEFRAVSVVRSSRNPGVIHDYEAEAAEKKKSTGSS